MQSTTHSNPTMDSTIDSTIIDVPSSPPLQPENLVIDPPDSPIAVAVANPLWVPHPYLEEDLHPILQRAIDRIPPSHLLPPSKNETFDTPDDAWTRLQDYAFSQGFAIVTGQCGKADPRKTYKCIHHSIETRNWRKLPEHKGEVDPEHGTTRLQESTKIKAKGCQWRVFIAYKDLTRGGSNRTWVLGLGKQEHSHDLSPNPLDYEIHQQRQPEHAKAIQLARTHRFSGTTYNQSMRILENTPKEPDEVFHIKKKKYYNLVPSTTRSRDEILTGLLECLDDPKFTAKVRYMYVKNDAGIPTKRVLQQIVLIDQYQQRLAKRFTSDFCIQNDATFNTNAQKLLLFVAVGVTNTNQSFPAAFSFSTQESEISYNFFFDACKELIWNDCNPPRVNISDQGKGLIASLPLMLPDCQLQLCNWHAVQNIRTRVNRSKRGYPHERRENVSDAAWDWVQSPDFTTLQENRDRLLDLLYEVDQTYFWEYWYPKESNVVTCYTRNYRNLGCSSTQRNESMHPILKAVMNPQATLENAVKAMQAELKLWYKNLRLESAKSRTERLRAVDFMAFHVVIGKITSFAIERVNPEWIAAKKLVEEKESQMPDWEPFIGPCNCEILVRYLLPCRHVLFRACDQGFPIPLSLFHPRWWINDDSPTPREFVPRYYDESLDPHDQHPSAFRDKAKNKYLETVAKLDDLHKNLPRQQADQLTNQIVTFEANVSSSHAAIQKNLQGIPTVLPEPPPTKQAAWFALQEKKKHDKANARKLLAVEASEKEARQQEKQEKQVSKPIYQIPPPPAFRPPPRRSPPPPAVQLAPPTSQPTLQPPQPVLQPQKPRGRPKGSKNSVPISAAPPSSSAPPVLTKSTSGRQIKEKKVWEQAKGLSQKRSRGPTLDATLQPAMNKKKSKQNMVPSEEVDERESQQRRILEAGFLLGGSKE